MVFICRCFYALLLLGRASAAVSQEFYTQNVMCRKNACTNPIAPGMNDLARLEQITWQCDPTQGAVRTYLSFCKDAVTYEPALPSPNSTSVDLPALIQAQENAASTMFFYHISALGYEGWDHMKPEHSPDSCIRSVWRMVCSTYLPKSPAGCQPKATVQYLRPCRTACTDYLQACQVECCDESPQCVFSHEVGFGDGASFLQRGYVDAEAPSTLCTGTGGYSKGSRAAAPLRGLLLLFLGLQLVAAALDSASKSSRDYDFIPQHSVGNWRQVPDYLLAYSIVSPGSHQSALNSCSRSPTNKASAGQQCSGRGYCVAWDKAPGSSSFCYCHSDYADPECMTKRRSQSIAFFLSLFGGFLGLDYLYLGFPVMAVSKACTLGGLGVWWLVDIIRIGTGRVYAHDFRVSPDLPKFVFVLSTVGLFLFGSFIGSILNYLRYRAKKRLDIQCLMQSEESASDFKPPMNDYFSGYGATLTETPHRSF